MKKEIINVKKEVQNKLRYNQMLLLISLALGTYFFVATGEIYIVLMFLVIGALSLPNINNSKSDLDKIFKHEFEDLSVKIVDIFPEKHSSKNKNWIIFACDEKNKIHEVTVHDDSYKINDQIQIKRTPGLRLIIEIKKI